MVYKDGSVYFGEFLEGKRHGKGRCIEKADETGATDDKKNPVGYKEWYGEWKGDKISDYDKADRQKAKQAITEKLAKAWEEHL